MSTLLLFKSEAAQQYTLPSDPGRIVISGSGIGLAKNSLMSATTGAYSESGTAASLVKSNLLSAGIGLCTVSGSDASLLKGMSLAANSGIFDETGQIANLLKDSVLGAGIGLCSVTGADATVLKNSVLPAAIGAVELSNNQVYMGLTRVGRPSVSGGGSSQGRTNVKKLRPRTSAKSDEHDLKEMMELLAHWKKAA